MVNNSMSLSRALSAYGSSTSSSQTQKSESTATSDASLKAATAKAAAPVQNSKSALARQQLNKVQLGLAKDINAALSKAGKPLTGAVEFNVDAHGALTMTGSDKDKANVAAVLKADKSTPSLTARLTAMDKQAEAFDRQNMQASALATAAKYTGNHAQNMMSTYQALMSHQSAASAVFSVSATSSQLTFKGAVDTKA
ncbi:MAG: hypothetical protein Q7U28_03055 [Aquabacterium sp.]|nr:hypothetical protein [Aquabacterium sp.]